MREDLIIKHDRESKKTLAKTFVSLYLKLRKWVNKHGN